MSTFSENPYLKELAGNMTDQMTQNFQRQVMPGLRSGTMVAGGYGGSRQGVLEANAQNDMQQRLSDGLSQLYSGGFNSSLNYDLGKYQSDNQYKATTQAAATSAAAQSSASQRQYELGMAQLDRQINQDNFGNRLQGAQFGLGAYNQLGANNNTALGIGNQVQNTPMNYWQQFANQSNAFGQGYGTQTQTSPLYSSPLAGAAGGMQMGNSFGNMWGGSPNSFGGTAAIGWGTGSGYGNQDYGGYL